MPVTRELTPRRRTEELAEILANGVLRWHEGRSDGTETASTCLELSPADRLSVPGGERSREARPADVEHDRGEN